MNVSTKNYEMFGVGDFGYRSARIKLRHNETLDVEAIAAVDNAFYPVGHGVAAHNEARMVSCYYGKYCLEKSMLPIDINSVKGFLPSDEGEALYHAADSVAHLGPMLEVGSYCGKSTVYLGSVAKQHNTLLYAVDHHKGSEEHQVGEEYHDPSLYDGDLQRFDTFNEFRRTLIRAELESHVVPIVSASAQIGRYWKTSLSFVFVDGGHSSAAALTDYRTWAPWVMKGGLLAIHDVFPNPADGGRPPFEIYQFAKASGLFEAEPLYKSLAILRRL